MGSWTIWHVLGFLILAIIAIWRSNASTERKQLQGYGGWLIVYSLFLIFWASQEVSELYRVQHEVVLLVPSALNNPDYLTYSALLNVLSWAEAIVLITCALLPALPQRRSYLIKSCCIGLWLAGPVAAAAEFIAANHFVGDYLLEEDYSTLGATLLFATLWTWYFLTSFRVRNTYK